MGDFGERLFGQQTGLLVDITRRALGSGGNHALSGKCDEGAAAAHRQIRAKGGDPGGLLGAAGKAKRHRAEPALALRRFQRGLQEHLVLSVHKVANCAPRKLLGSRPGKPLNRAGGVADDVFAVEFNERVGHGKGKRHEPVPFVLEIYGARAFAHFPCDPRGWPAPCGNTYHTVLVAP